MKKYKITLSSDTGKLVIAVFSKEIITAIQIVCKAQNAPLCAIIKAEECK